MEHNLIKPRTLKGFRDTLPTLASARNHLLKALQGTFQSFGFLPFDTPALELRETIAGKGGDESDKQMYGFEDAGGRSVAMRFDLTAPFARFVVQHRHELTFPFRGYRMGAVWRGERPQRGRYREFVQFDADVVGTSGSLADLETVTMFAVALETLAIGDFEVRVNDRRILNRILEQLGVRDNVRGVLRALDKSDKIGISGVEKALGGIGVDTRARRRLLELIAVSDRSNDEKLAELGAIVGESGPANDALALLRGVTDLFSIAGLDTKRVRIDPATVRGLDYYTGIVFETTYLPLPTVGSIASGGRYDDLTGAYTKDRLPGVGGSVGVDRILGALDELDALPGDREEPFILITNPESGDGGAEFALAMELRRSGTNVELYPEPRPHSVQLKYASSRGVRLAVTIDGAGVHVRDLVSRESHQFSRDAAAVAIVQLLGATC